MSLEKEQKISMPPYGYRFANDGTSLIKDEAEQALMGEIRKVLQAGISLENISNTLRSEGFLSNE